MTQEEKRIKLAEAQGWTDIGTIGNHGVPYGTHPEIEKRTRYVQDLPDYFNDLNDCQQIVFSLEPIQIAIFQHSLSKVSSERSNCFCELTSSDWANCLGLTLNLWKEGE